MDTKPAASKTDEEIRHSASLTSHEILTFFWGFSNRNQNNWEPEAWILLHNLCILASMRGKGDYGDWCMKILFLYSAGIIPTLEEKEKTTPLREDIGWVFKHYVDIANVLYHVHPNDEDRNVIAINNAFRKNRDALLARTDDAFAYILTQSDLEVKTIYKEHELHDDIASQLQTLKSGSLSTHFKVNNLQFEVLKETSEDAVQKVLCDFFSKKECTLEEKPMYTGDVYDKKHKLVCTTSVTVIEGAINSVAMITLCYPSKN